MGDEIEGYTEMQDGDSIACVYCQQPVSPRGDPNCICVPIGVDYDAMITMAIFFHHHCWDQVDEVAIPAVDGRTYMDYARDQSQRDSGPPPGTGRHNN